MGAERARKPESPAHAPAGKRGAGKASRLLKRCRDFALMLPLAAGIALGGCQKDECRSHNETTYRLKRATDGRTATLKEMTALSGTHPVAEPILDMVNEMHAISTGRIPDDATLTVAPEKCMTAYGRKSVAYAVPRSDYLSDRGVYLVSSINMQPVTLIGTLAHEIGHLQSRDNGPAREVVSQLNSFEQYEMGFVLLLRQGASQEDLVRWAFYMEFKGMAWDIEYHTGLSSEEQPLSETANEYARCLFYIFLKMEEHDGDYAKVREETRDLLRKNKLGDAVRQKTLEFTSRYDRHSYPELSISAKKLIFNNYLRRFGPEVAEAYLEHSSAILDAQLSIGIEGKSCVPAGDMFKKEYEPCDDDICRSTGAAKKMQVSARLCCLEMDSDTGEPAKHMISVSGDRYEGTLSFGGYIWHVLSNWKSIDSKEKLEEGEPCR